MQHRWMSSKARLHVTVEVPECKGKGLCLTSLLKTLHPHSRSPTLDWNSNRALKSAFHHITVVGSIARGPLNCLPGFLTINTQVSTHLSLKVPTCSLFVAKRDYWEIQVTLQVHCFSLFQDIGTTMSSAAGRPSSLQSTFEFS